MLLQPQLQIVIMYQIKIIKWRNPRSTVLLWKENVGVANIDANSTNEFQANGYAGSVTALVPIKRVGQISMVNHVTLLFLGVQILTNSR